MGAGGRSIAVRPRFESASGGGRRLRGRGRRLGAGNRGALGDPGGLETGRRWLDAGPGYLQLRKGSEGTGVVVDPGGRAIALWSRNDGFDYIVQSAELAPGSGSWSQPVDLSEKGENAEEPQVAVDGSGAAVAVWSHLETPDRIAQAAFRPPGGGWGAAEDLSEAGGVATEPQLSVDPGGSAIAVWTRTVGGVGTVQAADMAPGGNWLEAVDLSGVGDDATEPGVALAGGRALALWSLAGPGPYSAIQSRERLGGGAWQPSQDLTTRV